jgi:hypothetical protein
MAGSYMARSYWSRGLQSVSMRVPQRAGRGPVGADIRRNILKINQLSEFSHG